MVGFPTADQAAAENLRLQAGRFFDGDPLNNIVPSRDPAKFNNIILEELEGVIREAGLVPNWDMADQLRKSVLKIIADKSVTVDLSGTLQRLAKTYTAAGLTQDDVDTVLDGVFFTKGSLVGLSSESYVWVIQIFYSSVSATAKRKEIAYSYTGDAVYTRLYTTAWSGWSSVNQPWPLGKIDLMPFRAADLPTGWHVCNGGGFAITSAQGKALAALPANFKTDWKITTSGSTIYKPNLLTGGSVSGQGPFFRPSTSVPGTIVGDAIRNITGEGPPSNGTYIRTKGAFSNTSLRDGNLQDGGYPYYVVSFDASRVVPTAAENRPLAVAMTPAIWLGC